MEIINWLRSSVWFSFISTDMLISEQIRNGTFPLRLEDHDKPIQFIDSPIGVFGSLSEMVKSMGLNNVPARYRRVLDFGNQPEVIFYNQDDVRRRKLELHDSPTKKPDFLQSKEIITTEVWEVLSSSGAIDVYCFLEVRL